MRAVRALTKVPPTRPMRRSGLCMQPGPPASACRPSKWCRAMQWGGASAGSAGCPL